MRLSAERGEKGMIRKTPLLAGAAIAVAAVLALALPAAAGTCSQVTGKGRAKDPASATTLAQHELIQRAARFGGKIMRTSTNCKKDSPGYVCKMTAVVCPKKA
jgi:hypothetical protein